MLINYGIFEEKSMKANFKIIFILLAFSFSTLKLKAQTPKFSILKNGHTSFIVINFDSLNSKDLYQKSLEWFPTYFKNPNEVIKSKIENKLVRFEGYQRKYTGMLDCTYTIDLEFKDGKLKISIVEFFVLSSGYRVGSFNLFYGCYKKDGTLKRCGKGLKDTENVFNNISESLEAYLNNSSSNDW